MGRIGWGKVQLEHILRTKSMNTHVDLHLSYSQEHNLYEYIDIELFQYSQYFYSSFSSQSHSNIEDHYILTWSSSTLPNNLLEEI